MSASMKYWSLKFLSEEGIFYAAFSCHWEPLGGVITKIKSDCNSKCEGRQQGQYNQEWMKPPKVPLRSQEESDCAVVFMADWSEASSPRSVITSWSCGKRTMEVETSGGGMETRQYTVCQHTTVLHHITALATHTLQARPFPKPFSYSHGLRTDLQLFSFVSHSLELHKVIKL